MFIVASYREANVTHLISLLEPDRQTVCTVTSIFYHRPETLFFFNRLLIDTLNKLRGFRKCSIWRSKLLSWLHCLNWKH